MHRLAVLTVALSACASACTRGDGGSPGVPAGELCPALVDAICERESACGTFPDQPTCVAASTDAFDGCRLNVEAIARWEASYDGTVAGRYVDAVRAGACGSAPPDPTAEFAVFKPKLEEGAVCHSDVSCKAGLICDDVTIADPQGICTPL